MPEKSVFDVRPSSSWAGQHHQSVVKSIMGERYRHQCLHHLHHGLLCLAVSRTSAHSTQMSLPLLFATVHLLAFQKCFYDSSQSIEYLNSGRSRGQISPSLQYGPSCMPISIKSLPFCSTARPHRSP